MKILKTLTISDCVDNAASIAARYGGLDKGKCYVFSEDKITLSLELEIAKKCNGGFFNIEVMTFSRYIEQRTDGLKVLSKESSIMAIRKVILNCQKELVCFNNLKYCPNLSVTLYELISQLASAKVTPDDLISLIGSEDKYLSGALENKLKDISLIYKEYLAYLSERGFYDSSDFMSLMPSLVESDETLKDAAVILVGFSAVTKQRVDVFKSLNDAAKELYAVIVADESSEIYTNETLNRLLEIDKNAEVFTIKNNRLPEIIKLKNGLFNPEVFKKEFQGFKTDRITVKEAPDIQYESESVAKDIVKEVKLGNKRYKDIAVMVGNLDAYKLTVSKIFAEYGIPYYIDKANTLAEHPICGYILSYIDLTRKGLAVNDIIDFVSSGIFSTNKELIDAFSVYVKKYALSRNSFKEPLKYEHENFQEFEKIRQTVYEIYQKLSAAKSVESYIYAIEFMLDKTAAEENIKTLGEKLKASGEFTYADFNEKALEKVYRLLDEMQNVLGNVKISLLDFKTVFSSGAGGATVGAIPLFNDAVYVGECKDVKMKQADVLYAMGINGNVPFGKSDTAILSDGDLASLDKFKIIVEPKIRIVNKRERENVCVALMSFKDKLKISFSDVGGDGKPAIKSEIINYVLRIFNLLPIVERVVTGEISRLIKSNKNSPDVNGYVSDKFLSTSSAVREIAKVKADYLSGKGNFEVASFFKAVEEIGNNVLYDKADKLLSANSEKCEKISRAGMCLSGSEISATTLEEYFGCPYSNYVKNVLKLKSVETGEMQANEIGTALHSLVEIYAKRVNEVSDKQSSDALVDTITTEIFSSEKYSKYLTKPYYTYLFNSLKEEGKFVCYNIFRTVNESEFKPYILEARFGNGCEREAVSLQTRHGNFKVKGVVDRVDICNNEIRIIDYKSGKIHSDVESFYTGNNLQLYLYMNAFIRDGLKPAGAYYFPVYGGYIEENKVMSYIMDGNTVNEEAVLSATDNLLKNKQTSNIVPVKYTSNGSIHKSQSKVLLRDEMDSYINYALKIASNGVDEICEGFIKATPYNPEYKCKYCEYAGLCGTDLDTVEGRKLKGITPETVINAVSLDSNSDEDLQKNSSSDKNA